VFGEAWQKALTAANCERYHEPGTACPVYINGDLDSYHLGADNQGGGEFLEQPFIVCRKCGRKSYHPVDIAEKYCGNCREWHERKP
jgi:ribosomal protein L37E